MRCGENGCDLEATGYDIEACYDESNEPVWAVFYECPEGHKFLAEFERVCQKEEVA